jgi:hypothetical protein
MDANMIGNDKLLTHQTDARHGEAGVGQRGIRIAQNELNLCAGRGEMVRIIGGTFHSGGDFSIH